jgi:PAS domain-containing protein
VSHWKVLAMRCATDRSSLVTFANSVALQLLGRSKASMIGRPLADSLIRRADLSLIPWNE